MNSQLLKKIFGYTSRTNAYTVLLVGVILFSAIAKPASAQKKLKVEGPPRPGYICRCLAPGYGCSGSYACLNRCRLACHRTLITGTSSNSISGSSGTPVFIVASETQKKMHQMEWKGSNENRTTIVPVNNQLQIVLKN